MFKLNDPNLIATHEARCEFFKSRARQAIQNEKKNAGAYNEEIVSQLANIAVVLELRNGGDSADPIEQFKRGLLGALNKASNDGQCIVRALKELENALNASSQLTKNELVDGLEAAGVDPDSLCNSLEILRRVAGDLGSERTRKIKQGQATTQRAVAIGHAWCILKPTGLSRRACSRVIAYLLDGDESRAERVFSSINEFAKKADRH